MNRLISCLLHVLRVSLRSRHALIIENLALRQQLSTLKNEKPRPRLTMADRVFWIILRRTWSRWADALIIVKPETVVRWHRAGFKTYWRLKSRNVRRGRPRITNEIRELINQMRCENPTWGSPHPCRTPQTRLRYLRENRVTILAPTTVGAKCASELEDLSG